MLKTSKGGKKIRTYFIRDIKRRRVLYGVRRDVVISPNLSGMYFKVLFSVWQARRISYASYVGIYVLQNIINTFAKLHPCFGSALWPYLYRRGERAKPPKTMAMCRIDKVNREQYGFTKFKTSLRNDKNLAGCGELSNLAKLAAAKLNSIKSCSKQQTT